MDRNNASWISLDYLKTLLSKPDPAHILDYILRNKKSFRRIVQLDLGSPALIRILKILVHVSNVEFEAPKSEILEMTFNEDFTNKIRNYLSKVNNGNSQVKYYVVKDDLLLIVRFLDIIVNELPISGEHYTRFISLLEEVLKTIINAKFENLPMRNWVEDLILLLKIKNLHLDRQTWSYKDVSLYPSPFDFFEKKILRSNKIKEPYKNAQEYLEINFKLLQEDYIRSISDGISQYKRELRGAEKATNPAIYVYENVLVHSIDSNMSPRDGILHVIQFSSEDEKRLKDEKKSDSKRFMNGQLLFLSSHSQFTTFVLATVVDRNYSVLDEKKEVRKALRLSVIAEPFKLRVKEKYVLIEPKTFFEPYYQVLKAFQSIEPLVFPMAKYIVYSDFEPCLPSYLSPSEANLFLNHFDSHVAPLVSLNESQLRALKAALTNEFTIIQGPPGTGKTHLVKSIINMLIKFKENRSAPIFIVCSRNNSLDHVIGPLAESGRKIIRLGGQTKSDVLKTCTVSKLKTKWTNKRATTNNVNALKNNLISKQNAEYSEYSVEFAELQKEISAFMNLCDNEDANILAQNDIDVIGATTTGAARLRNMMSMVKPEVVIIEEAAEVFESHVVSSIPEGCKHVILIGDHKQLQPTPSHMSSQKRNMHISLFERLVMNGMSFCSLTEQFRMRPEIAALISPLIYGNLKNHKSVENYPCVKGVSRNMFFIDHIVPEERETDTGSHWNKHEAQMLLALANYFLKQGYSGSDITILAGYSAQVTYLIERQNKNKSLENVRVTSIDNYQGEENLIILLSLVRSQTGSIGFLKTYNRVNVALSRAKHGLFIIGNITFLSNHSDLWKSLKSIFEKYGAIDRRLPLQCHPHKNITYVKSVQDFEKLTYGGCTFKCGLKLVCGHCCQLSCHPSEIEHNSVKCEQICQRIICMVHNTECNWKCHEGDCRKCTKTIQRKCGHQIEVPCHQSTIAVPCTSPCNRVICKVHKTVCNRTCHEDCEECTKTILKLKSCGHSVRVPCNQSIIFVPCTSPCNRVICRIHKTVCNRKCYEDCGKCTKTIQKQQECGHSIRILCHQRSPTLLIPCTSPCNRTCLKNGHKCYKKCNEPCGPCQEPVSEPVMCCFSRTVRCHESWG